MSGYGERKSFNDRGGGRGGFNDRGGGRGGFNDRGGGRGGGFNDRGGYSDRGESRGGYDRGVGDRGGRGGFNDRGGGRGGGFNDRGGGRGGFNERSGPYEDRGGGRGGFNDRGGGRGGFNDRGGGRGGFNDRGGGRGGFNDRGRGGSGFGGGGRGASNSIPLEGQVQFSQITKTLCKLTLSDRLKLPDRPGFCEIGTPVTVGINCFDIDFTPKDAYMYDFEVKNVYFADKPEEPVKMSPKDIRSFKAYVHKAMPSDVSWDGGRILFSLRLLDGVDLTTKQKRTVVKDPNGRGDLIVTYDIQQVQQVSSSSLKSYVTNKLATEKYPHEAIRFLDCVFRSISGEKADHTVRNSFYISKPTKCIPNKLMNLHRGIFTSIRPQWKVRINVDMTCKAFFPPGSLADTLYEKYRDSMEDPSRWKNMFLDIKELKVMASFYKNKDGKQYSRKLTVKGLSDKDSKSLIIKDLNQTVYEYFKQHHNITLRYPNLPCVNTSAKREVYLPMELLTPCPFQAPNASKADLASEIVRCAAVKPQERFKELADYVKQLAASRHEMMSQHGVVIKPEMVQAVGRVLPVPKPFSQGQWNQNSFDVPANKNESLKWAVVSVGCRGKSYEADDLLKKMPETARQFGINLARANIIQAYPSDIDRLMKDCLRDGIRLIMFVMYDKNAYARIKFLGDLAIGMVTQCILPVTITKPRTLNNVLLKVNAKLGGINWRVNYCQPKNEIVQVFGIDVTHPGPGGYGSEIKKSIAAVSGSISADLMKYSCVVRQQLTNDKGNRTTKEIVDRLDIIVKDLILACKSETGQLPTRLIFYRDGVSEGQFISVLISELRYIQEACKAIQPGYEPGITYITVQKRHHIRFMPLDGSSNVAPGTLVDKEITHPSEFDFYLCSHAGIQGTSVPAHYCVLYDDNNWVASNLQSFTYALCYAFMRCSRSVSIPAPTYYSHLAAFRAREWLAGCDKSSKFLENDLFTISNCQKRSMFFI